MTRLLWIAILAAGCVLSAVYEAWAVSALCGAFAGVLALPAGIRERVLTAVLGPRR